MYFSKVSMFVHRVTEYKITGVVKEFKQPGTFYFDFKTVRSSEELSYIIYLSF